MNAETLPPSLARADWIAQLLVVVGRIQLDLNRLLYNAGRVGALHDTDDDRAATYADAVVRDLADAYRTFETLAEKVAELAREAGR